MAEKEQNEATAKYTPRSVLEACFQAVQDADLGAPVSKWLSQIAGDSSQKHARLALEFLDLLRGDSGNERFTPEMALWREDEELLAGELTARVRAGYTAAGCRHADHIGEPFHTDDSIRLILASEEPFKRDNKKTQDNVLRTAIHYHNLVKELREKKVSSQGVKKSDDRFADGMLDTASGESSRPQLRNLGTHLNFVFRLQQVRSEPDATPASHADPAVTAEVQLHTPSAFGIGPAEQAALLDVLAARLLDEADRLASSRRD